MSGLLFVCTGNICRSPTAAALLVDRLALCGVSVEVSSAGVRQQAQPPPPEAVRAAASFGVDISAHRSRQLDATEIAGADLVIGMARQHVREVVVALPAAWPKTFTLLELVRRGAHVGPRRRGEQLGDWLGKVHQGRNRAELLGDSPDDDVADPMGGPPSAYKTSASVLAQAVSRLVELAWPAPL